jgi:hypothetical protein
VRQFDLYPTNGYVRYTWRSESGWDKGVWEKDPYVRIHVANTVSSHLLLLIHGAMLKEKCQGHQLWPEWLRGP